MSNKFFESIGGAPAYSSVSVAVKGSVGDAVGGAASRRALRWAVENFLPKIDRLVLVHVMPAVTSIPSPCKLNFEFRLSVSPISWKSHRNFGGWFCDSLKLDRRFRWRNWKRVLCRCINEIWGRNSNRFLCRLRRFVNPTKWVFVSVYVNPDSIRILRFVFMEFTWSILRLRLCCLNIMILQMHFWSTYQILRLSV